jgi:hypothetical protein
MTSPNLKLLEIADGETTSLATISKTSSLSWKDARHFSMRSKRPRPNCADLLERR